MNATIKAFEIAAVGQPIGGHERRSMYGHH